MSLNLCNNCCLFEVFLSELSCQQDMEEYFEVLKNYDEELRGLTGKIWESEYLSV